MLAHRNPERSHSHSGCNAVYGCSVNQDDQLNEGRKQAQDERKGLLNASYVRGDGCKLAK